MKGFPVHPCDRGDKNILGINCIPWEVIEPHERQAVDNHGQSLEELARRHGLTFYELYCVLSDIRHVDNPSRYTDQQYMYAVVRMVGSYYCKQIEEGLSWTE